MGVGIETIEIIKRGKCGGISDYDLLTLIGDTV